MSKLILYGDPYELNHYVLKRLLKRAGLDETLFRKVPIGDPFLHTYPEPVIVSLGDKALEHLISERDSFRWFNRVVQWGTKLVVPNLLPSKLLPFKDYDAELDEDNHRHPPRLHGIVMASYRKAQRIAVDGYQPQRQEYYLQDPLPKQFERWAQEYLSAGNPPLSFDIETPYKLKKSSEEDYDEQEYDRDIIRISFSYIPHHSVSIPFSPEYHNSIRTLLATPSQKIVWNGRTFDIPILSKQEFPVNGEIYDGMDAWHFVQSDLEKGLEFVSGIYTDILPWKHLNNAQPAYYSCIDADAALQICLKVQKEIADRGLTDAFKTLSIDCMMYLDEAGRRGNYIDIERQNALRIMLQEKQALLLADIQTIVPNHLKPVSVYKKEPGVPHTKVPIIGEVKICSTCKQEITSKSTHQKGKGNPCKNAATEKVAGTVYQYEVIEDFNPNSGKQVLNYIKHYNHPVGKNHKTGNESADTKHLKKLAGKYGKQHPLYTKIVEAHKISKALSTYVEGLKPDASGRVYSTYVNAPSTWRLSSRNVNMQNQGKRSGNPYAKEARKTIIAPPGHVFVQADSSSIEAVMVGYFMNDAHYLDIAKRSVHGYLCCAKLGWEFTPDNVDKIKKDYADLYDAMKITNHMTNYGGTPSMLYGLFPELYGSRKKAAEMQQFIFDALPTLPKWHHEIQSRAQKEGYLQNPFGIRHYFYDVFSYQVTPNGAIRYGTDGLPKIKLGKDAKRAIAFLPQSSAGCFARQNIVRIGESPMEPYMPANITVHDGYCLVVPKNLVDKAIETLYTILTRPIPEMGGLTIGCEVEIGDNWGEMEKVKL